MLDILASYADWIVGITACLVVIGTVLRKMRKRGLATLSRINEGLETLAGREEIRHPETGAVLAEATPALGTRFANLENAFSRLADTHDALAALGQRLVDMDHKLDAHIQACPPGGANSVTINAGPQPTITSS